MNTGESFHPVSDIRELHLFVLGRIADKTVCLDKMDMAAVGIACMYPQGKMKIFAGEVLTLNCAQLKFPSEAVILIDLEDIAFSGKLDHTLMCISRDGVPVGILLGINIYSHFLNGQRRRQIPFVIIAALDRAFKPRDVLCLDLEHKIGILHDIYILA